jgi:hypothetical protein
VFRQEIELPSAKTPENPSTEETLSFWEELYAVPLNQWASEGEKGYKVYLYEGTSGPYIALITEPVDVEWVKQKFGGGSYRAQLNDPSGKIVQSQRFTIEGESKRRPTQPPQPAAPVPAPAADNFQSQVLEILRESQRRQEQMIERLVNREAPIMPAAQVDPNIMLRGVVEMFTGLLSKAQASSPQTSLLETLALLEKLRGPDLLTVLKQAKEAGLIPAAGAGAPGDLISQITQFKEAAETLGLGEGKGKSLGEALIDKGPEILQGVGTLIDRYKGVEEARLHTARTVREIQIQQRGAVVPPAPQPGAPGMTVQHIPAAAAPAPAGSSLELENPTAPAAISEAEQRDAFIKQKLVEMIANGDTGEQIVFFLDTIDERICASFEGATVDQIAGYFASDPILKKTTTLPRLRAALGEIVEVLNAPDEEIDPAAKVVN